MLLVFSVTDSTSLVETEEVLQYLWKTGSINTRATIVVGNKADLVRTREVPIDGEMKNTTQFLVKSGSRHRVYCFLTKT